MCEEADFNYHEVALFYGLLGGLVVEMWDWNRVLRDDFIDVVAFSVPRAVRRPVEY